MNRPAQCVCLGYGWDSAAMLILMAQKGEPVDLITWADTGGEKEGTYAFVPVFDAWLVEHGLPQPRHCRYAPKEKTADKYRQAVLQVAQELSIKLQQRQLDRLALLYGNMVANDTLPGIAFGPKSCSIKWKLEAQEPI